MTSVDHFSSGTMRLHKDDLIREYKALCDMIHSYGAMVIPQIAMEIYAKQNIYGQWEQRMPGEMTEVDVQIVIDKFVNTAVRAQKAGFDGVEFQERIWLSSFKSGRDGDKFASFDLK